MIWPLGLPCIVVLNVRERERSFHAMRGAILAEFDEERATRQALPFNGILKRRRFPEEVLQAIRRLSPLGLGNRLSEVPPKTVGPPGSVHAQPVLPVTYQCRFAEERQPAEILHDPPRSPDRKAVRARYDISLLGPCQETRAIRVAHRSRVVAVEEETVLTVPFELLPSHGLLAVNCLLQEPYERACRMVKRARESFPQRRLREIAVAVGKFFCLDVRSREIIIQRI